MFKNQLQELAQRSCFNLPAYACIRVGPDHAPSFKASVNFNGEIFESPTYCTTLRQAEHAAAEVALNALSSQGPSRSLTARVLDETGIYKNLLQETAHRAGFNLPAYTTVRSGPGHAPIFTSTVEIAGVTFTGEPAKTKKQAEKNAAIAAWSTLKTIPNLKLSGIKEGEAHEDQDQSVFITRPLSNFKSKDEQSKQARRRMVIRGHYINTIVSSSSPSSPSSSSLDHSSRNQPWKLPNPELGSEGCCTSTQRQNNNNNNNPFVSLLPPPPPRTVSMILPESNRSIQTIQDKIKPHSELEKTIEEMAVPSPALAELEHLKDEEEWLGTTTNGKPIPHQPISTWRIPINPDDAEKKRSKFSSTRTTRGGFNIDRRPYRVAPAVQIRSVIPVCSAPPSPVGPSLGHVNESAWTCNNNNNNNNSPTSSNNEVVKTIKESRGQLVSELGNKLQL